jgi:alkylhydroperoxidase family enzyme
VKAYGDEKVVAAALADPEHAPIPDKVKVTLRFLETLTLEPHKIDADSIRALHAAGLSDEAIEEAAYVATCFNCIDRLADAFDFKPNDSRGLKWVSRILLKVGYSAGSIPG